MRITGTFLDEISHDIPHQNWGWKEWERDFQAMKAFGIRRVILIRCGFKKFVTFPSKVLQAAVGAYTPPLDLLDMFLTLADRYGMEFFFGTYDFGGLNTGLAYDVAKETDLMRRVVDEAWENYGHHPSFKGWYFTQEIARRNPQALESYRTLGAHCKSFSPNLKILISPGMLGPKAYDINMKKIGDRAITLEQHEVEWDENMARIHDFIDIIAFQDGHLEFEQLPDFLAVNKKLCDRYGIACWTNTESFDRDMPINFLPIKWEKLLLKMTYAAQAGIEDFITFEFSHFLSPNSCYHSAHGLFDRYCEYFHIDVPNREDFHSV